MSNIFENMLKMYEDSHKPRPTSNFNKFDVNNYFSTFLEPGVNSDTKRVRILPPSNGEGLPWTEMYGHKIQVEGKWRTFACLQHEEGQPCPFCEARELLLASGVESEKELAKTYQPKLMYIVKVLDRADSENRVKFWRFNYSFTKNGTLDKIMNAVNAAGSDITHPTEGRDILIDISRNQTNIPIVNSVNCVIQPQPILDDEAKVQQILADERTWRNVYPIKSYDYLKIVVKGGVPMWDKNKEQYVDKNKVEADSSNENLSEDLDKQLAVPQNTSMLSAMESTSTNVGGTSQASQNSEDDDLPF